MEWIKCSLGAFLYLFANVVAKKWLANRVTDDNGGTADSYHRGFALRPDPLGERNSGLVEHILLLKGEVRF